MTAAGRRRRARPRSRRATNRSWRAASSSAGSGSCVTVRAAGASPEWRRARGRERPRRGRRRRRCSHPAGTSRARRGSDRDRPRRPARPAPAPPDGVAKALHELRIHLAEVVSDRALLRIELDRRGDEEAASGEDVPLEMGDERVAERIYAGNACRGLERVAASPRGRRSPVPRRPSRAEAPPWSGSERRPRSCSCRRGRRAARSRGRRGRRPLRAPQLRRGSRRVCARRRPGAGGRRC